jgi:hypothetical protein
MKKTNTQPDQPANTVGEWTKTKLHISNSPVTQSDLSKLYFKSVKNTKSIGGSIICNAFGATKEEGEANAARIVETWNNYDQVKADNRQLLEALKECQDYFDYMKGANHVSSRDARDKTKAAISKHSVK